jgi:hypothetical protein
MATNTLLTPDQITREALRILHQKLNFVGNIDRQYDNSFASEGAKIGDTLRIRKPNRYVAADGATFAARNTNEESVSLPVTKQKHVGMEFTSKDLTLDIDDFSSRVVEPAMSVLAATVEADALTMTRNVFNQVGTPGSTPTLKNFLEGRKKLNDNLAPAAQRCALVNTQTSVDIVDSVKGLFQDSSEISRQYKEGMMGRSAGFDWYENTLIEQQEVGAGNQSYDLSSVASEGDSTISVDTGTGAVKAGQKFTIANVFEVHPETKASTNRLKQFTVTADYAGGSGDISIAPAVYASATDGRKNVDALPQNNADVTFLSTASTNYDQNLVFQKDAFTFATADLVLPKGLDFASRQTYDGISLRIIRDYDLTNDQIQTRCDILYGFVAQRPELASIVAA